MDNRDLEDAFRCKCSRCGAEFPETELIFSWGFYWCPECSGERREVAERVTALDHRTGSKELTIEEQFEQETGASRENMDAWDWDYQEPLYHYDQAFIEWLKKRVKHLETMI